jgi:hypothetical protein
VTERPGMSLELKDIVVQQFTVQHGGISVNDFIAIANQVDLHNWPVPLSMEVVTNPYDLFRYSYINEPKEVMIKLKLSVRERDSGQHIEVCQRRCVSAREIHELKDEQEALKFLFNELMNIVQHEMSECFRYNKSLPFDPHSSNALPKMEFPKAHGV